MWIDNWKQKAKQLKQEAHAAYLAMKDPRTPWYARALAAIVVGYAFSPIDLIPDPIPVLGYLDDLVLIPLGIMQTWDRVSPYYHIMFRQVEKPNPVVGIHYHQRMIEAIHPG